MMSARSCFLVFLASITLGCCFSLHAASATFIPASGNFNVPSNWSTGQIPGPGDTATVQGNSVCAVTDNRTVAVLNVSGATVNVTAPGQLTAGAINFNANTFPNCNLGGTGNIVLTGIFDWDRPGAISGSGQLILANGAVMNIPNTVTLDARPIVIQSGGRLNYNASSASIFNMNNGARIDVQSGGTLDVSTANPINALNGATIVNAGTFSRGTGGLSDIQPAVSNSGLLHIQAGTLLFSGGYTDNGGSVYVDGGTFKGTLNLTSGTLLGFGNVEGNVNQTGGIIVPGAPSSPGVIDVIGNFSQGAAGQLQIPINGTVFSENFSRMDVTGTANIGGQIKISLLDGFVPAPTDTFDVVIATSVTGAFAAVDAGGSGFGPFFQPAKVVLQKIVNVISVTTIDGLPSPARSGGDVVLTATVANPGNANLTYTWNFGDGTSGSGNPVTHAFTAVQDTTFTVSLQIFDGQQNASGTMAINVLAPNAGGSGTNLAQGKMVSNPLSGLQIGVTSSNAGLLELNINADAIDTPGAIARAVNDIETSFASDSDSLPSRSGSKVVQKFGKSTIYSASTVVKDPASGATRARARKTVAVSSREVGQADSSIVEPQNRALLTVSLAGKFIFNVSKNKPDKLTYTGSFEMPAGLDLSGSQTLVFAMGNVIDSITVNSKGKGRTPSTNGTIKSLKVKFPRVNRKSPLTKPGQIAKLTITYFTNDLDLKGFDTEGITDRVRADEAGQKSVQRSIQLAMNLSGVTYEAAVPVEFKLTKTFDSGSIKGRRAN